MYMACHSFLYDLSLFRLHRSTCQNNNNMRGRVSPVIAGNPRHQKSLTCGLMIYNQSLKVVSHYKVPSSDVLVDPTEKIATKVSVVE